MRPGSASPARGKLGVLLPGLGAVATTYIAGVLAVRKRQGQPFGSVAELGHIRLGKRADDVVVFLDLAGRAKMKGVQEWLGFYFRSPLTLDELPPEHDPFIQQLKFKNTIRTLAGEEPITRLEDR